MSRVIRAAGGLVFRVTPRGRIKVLVAHRPRYDDWGLPKGKHDPGESDEQAALREVLEETGFRCRIVEPLPGTRHKTGDKVKEVAWFAMRPLPDSPGFGPNDEIDEIKWLSPRRAARLVDYENDRRLIENAKLKKLAATGTFWVVRHATAVDKEAWSGPDEKRPLDGQGKKQAKRIAKVLRNESVERIVSSPARRCVATVKPLAVETGARIERDERLAKTASSDDLAVLLDSLVGHNAVLCTHGEIMTGLLEAIVSRGAKIRRELSAAKGSIWRVEIRNGRFSRARYRASA
jgi:8-oxo-(d)GTP phosphatase